jgi:hypothetical protein
MEKIVDAEKEGQQILETAEREVSELRKNVSNKIASIRREILDQAAEQRGIALAEAERAGAQEAERIALEAKRHVELLSQISEDKRKRAVKRAIELLLS